MQSLGVNSISRISLIALFFGLVTVPAVADQAFRVCSGEDQANGCPVSKDVMFGCGVSPDQMATSVCTITDNGQKKVQPYRIVRQGSHDGGQCGYEWYSVTCIGK
jgi:hypothetical protein